MHLKLQLATNRDCVPVLKQPTCVQEIYASNGTQLHRPRTTSVVFVSLIVVIIALFITVIFPDSGLAGVRHLSTEAEGESPKSKLYAI